MKTAAEYADIIIRDEREKIKNENSTIHTANKIERIYEFHDGAVVRYEWQSAPFDWKSLEENYNHKFTLVSPPKPNPRNFKKGIVKIIYYPSLS